MSQSNTAERGSTAVNSCDSGFSSEVDFCDNADVKNFAPPEDALIDVGDFGDAGDDFSADLFDLEVTGQEGFSIRKNPFFKPLGYCQDNGSYYMCRRTSRVHLLTSANMKGAKFLELAPLSFWAAYFPKHDARKGSDNVNWLVASDQMLIATMRLGVWEPSKLLLQGMRFDRGHFVFNTGSRLVIDGEKVSPISDYNGDFTYAISAGNADTPDTIGAFGADSPELKEAKQIIEALDWKKDTRELSVIALFGYLCMVPLCGILKWKSHLWIDGPFSSGKTWVVQNIISPVLSDYLLRVQSNTSEAAIRAMISNKAIGASLDEAEGSKRRDKERMESVLTLIRACSAAGGSNIVQGISGGGGVRTYSTDCMFVLTSIVPQLEEAADHSRFARLHLGYGRPYDEFHAEIEAPAKNLFTPEFSRRWIGRMLKRAVDYDAVRLHMTRALNLLGTGPRLADVFGTFAAGCWLMLRDDTPSSPEDALAFLQEEFHCVEQIQEASADVMDNRCHDNLFQFIIAETIFVDGAKRREQSIGALIAAAVGKDVARTNLSPADAIDYLMTCGIRVGDENGKACNDPALAKTILFHTDSRFLKKILKEESSEKGYANLMLQHPDAVRRKTTRFGVSHRPCRAVSMPLTYFDFGEDE